MDVGIGVRWWAVAVLASLHLPAAASFAPPWAVGGGAWRGGAIRGLAGVRGLGMGGRTIVVGDVHGCREELEELLRACRYSPGNDRLVFVGDLVAKGPDSMGVLRLARSLGAETVAGNHELKVIECGQRLRSPAEAALGGGGGGTGGFDGAEEGLTREVGARGVIPSPWAGVRGTGFEGTPLEALRESEHWELATELEAGGGGLWGYIADMPLFLELPDHGAVVVHAGVLPGVPLTEMTPRDITTMRTVCESEDGSLAASPLGPGGHGASSPPPRRPWTDLWSGPETVIYGHDASRGFVVGPRGAGGGAGAPPGEGRPAYVGLDSGCVYGGRLSAYVLPDDEVVSVEAKSQYSTIVRKE